MELEHRLHSVKRLLPVRLPQDADVIHHRLDLLPTSKTLCRHLKQITSFGKRNTEFLSNGSAHFNISEANKSATVMI